MQDTCYRVIRNEAVFNTTFTTTDGNARKPDFSGQTVVAVLLPQPTGNGLMFEKGEIVGNTLHVYGLSCSPGINTNCYTGPALAATVPTSGNVTKVQFFINGSSRATVNL